MHRPAKIIKGDIPYQEKRRQLSVGRGYTDNNCNRHWNKKSPPSLVGMNNNH